MQGLLLDDKVEILRYVMVPWYIAILWTLHMFHNSFVHIHFIDAFYFLKK